MDTHSNKEKRNETKSPTVYHENVDFKTAIELTEVGIFHVSIALVCGFSFLASGLQNSLNAYILPSVHCDLDITSSEMGLLNAMFLAGGICSAFLWGVVADLFGRRMVMVYGMLVDGLLTLVSSFTQSYSLLLVFRFLNGFVVGGPSSLVFAYMSEFFPERLRAKVICYCGVFWTSSWIILPAVAWVVIPIKWAYVTEGFHFNSWRILVMIFAFPSLISAGILYVYPESPRFILARGKEDKALEVLASVYSWNTKNPPSSYPVKSLLKEELTSKEEEADSSNKSVFKPVIILIKQIQHLFSFPTLKITMLASSLFFCNMFGYYGLGLWLPELFNRFEKHYRYYPDETVTLCEVKTVFPHDNSTITEAVCDSTAVDGSVFMKSVIMGIVGLFGNVISGVLAGRLHRRTLPFIMMTLAGTCVIVIYFLRGPTYNLAVTTGFQLFVGTANLLYNSLVVDMFPPSISGMGVCLGILSGRLGAMVSNLVFGNLLDVNCSVPIFMVAGVNLAGALFSALIPKYPYSEERISSAKSISLS